MPAGSVIFGGAREEIFTVAFVFGVGADAGAGAGRCGVPRLMYIGTQVQTAMVVVVVLVLSQSQENLSVTADRTNCMSGKVVDVKVRAGLYVHRSPAG